MESLLKQEASNCVKVVLFGPESTGKTELAKALAEYYNTLWVPEYSRFLAEEKNKNKEQLSRNDVLTIAKGQMALENKLTTSVEQLLICDTDLLETKVYSEYYYKGFCPDQLTKYAAENYYNLYFLTNIDIPWEADNIRDKPHEREALFLAFQKALKKYNKPFVLLEGDFNVRLKSAIRHIDNLLKQK